MPERILITGSHGRIGKEILDLCDTQENEIIPVDVEDFDFKNIADINAMFKETAPSMIIHTAGYTNIEESEQNEEECMAINYEATKKMVENSLKNGIKKFIFISTCHVFDGTKADPYTERDECRPINVFGMSKWKAEQEVLKMDNRAIVIRPSEVFGEGYGNYYSDKILNFVRQGTKDIMSVISDETFNPTYSVDLAYAVKTIINHTNTRGIFHVTNDGATNWYDFAKRAIEYSESNKKAVPIESDKYASLAKRPKNRILNCIRSGHYAGVKLRSWESALEDYIYLLKENV